MPAMLRGLMVTALADRGIVLVLGLALAIPLTLARMSRRRLYRLAGGAFVIFFRGAPLLILLYLVYYGLGQISVPARRPALDDLRQRLCLRVIGADPQSCRLYGRNPARQPAGRAGRLGRGQRRARHLRRAQTFIWIRFPLAMRYGLKAYQNEVVMFTKGTAVVSVITVIDLTAAANEVFEDLRSVHADPYRRGSLLGVRQSRYGSASVCLERYLNRHHDCR